MLIIPHWTLLTVAFMIRWWQGIRLSSVMTLHSTPSVHNGIHSRLGTGPFTYCVVPQNFPSHISQYMSRIISKWLKIAQELDSQIISYGSQSQLRVLYCIKVLTSKWPQVLNNRLICSQIHPCQISSLAEEVWSVNCSRGPKIDCVRAKVNCDLQIVKHQDFLSTLSFLSDLHYFIKGWSWLLKEFPKFIKTQKLLN